LIRDLHCALRLDDHIATISDRELPHVALVQMIVDTDRPHAKLQGRFKRDFEVRAEDMKMIRKLKEESCGKFNFSQVKRKLGLIISFVDSVTHNTINIASW
jgi:hypothetical protein